VRCRHPRESGIATIDSDPRAWDKPSLNQHDRDLV
jgi:hypothetical protein